MKQNSPSEIIRQTLQRKSSNRKSNHPMVVADELTDHANGRELKIVIRYTKNNIPFERLFKYAECQNVKAAVSPDIITAFTRRV